jgi:hypothetical protein
VTSAQASSASLNLQQKKSIKFDEYTGAIDASTLQQHSSMKPSSQTNILNERDAINDRSQHQINHKTCNTPDNKKQVLSGSAQFSATSADVESKGKTYTTSSGRVRLRKKTRSKQKNMRKDTRDQSLKPTYRQQTSQSITQTQAGSSKNHQSQPDTQLQQKP